MAYIDKDLLLKDIGESVVFTVKSGFISPELRGARKIIDRIENAPTADVVEVKHGEWLFEGTNEDVHRRACSVCNGLLLVKWYDHTYAYRYCPNCGAKMDGGKEA